MLLFNFCLNLTISLTRGEIIRLSFRRSYRNWRCRKNAGGLCRRGLKRGRDSRLAGENRAKDGKDKNEARYKDGVSGQAHSIPSKSRHTK